MANTEVIEKTVEAAEAVNEMGVIPEIGAREIGCVALGAAGVLFIEHVAIPVAKKGVKWVASNFGKTKTVVVTAEEVVEVEE